MAAAGSSPWAVMNQVQANFGIGCGVSLDSIANLTYTVQHTFDDPAAVGRPIAIARVGTTATVTDVAHHLNTGDSVVIWGSGDPNLDTQNGSDITVTGVDTYTYTVGNTGATASGTGALVRSFRVFPHVSLVNLTAKADGNYAFPIEMIRLKITAYTAGSATLAILQGMGR
jgi:hypothetical protein